MCMERRGASHQARGANDPKHNDVHDSRAYMVLGLRGAVVLRLVARDRRLGDAHPLQPTAFAVEGVGLRGAVGQQAVVDIGRALHHRSTGLYSAVGMVCFGVCVVCFVSVTAARCAPMPPRLSINGSINGSTDPQDDRGGGLETHTQKGRATQGIWLQLFDRLRTPPTRPARKVRWGHRGLVEQSSSCPAATFRNLNPNLRG